jgi:heptosyltransferase-2
MAGGRVVVAPNWLGDCIMAFPVLRALRKAHPGEPLAILARPNAAGLFRAEGSADAVLERSSLLADARRLRAGQFAEAWLLPNSFRSAVTPFLAGISRRVGYDTDHRSVLLTDAVPEPDRAGQQLRDYDALLRSRGIAPDLDPPRLSPPPEAIARAREILAAAGIERPRRLALLAPGAAFGPTKRWLPERFGRLSDLLAQRGFGRAAVIGPGEEALGSAVAASARAPLPVLGAELDSLNLGALFSLASVVVANDSGPAHLAAAAGTPVIAFFGPTDPSRTAPSGAPVRVLDRYVPCSPCFLKKCPFGHECMREISPEDALQALLELIGSG